MATAFEDLRILRIAEEISDGIWQQVTSWSTFDRDVVGSQLARAADSIGANIAESFGRYNYGEKLQFLYYARGSLFETKYWLNRALTRGLLSPESGGAYISQLADLTRQLNAFAASIKHQRANKSSGVRNDVLKDDTPAYQTADDLSTCFGGRHRLAGIAPYLRSLISDLNLRSPFP